MSNTLPNPKDFLLTKGLYEKIPLGKKDYDVAKEILDLEFFENAIRTYCPDCGQESTFRTDSIRNGSLRSLSNPHFIEHSVLTVKKLLKTKEEIFSNLDYEQIQNYAFLDKTFTLEFYCTHEHNHRIFYTFNIKNRVIQKIGQFPSIADSLESEISQYKKVLAQELGNDKSQEFAKAIGLFSHGIGIGSFVYLRRIFEAFIYQAKDEALKAGSITDEEFKKARMVDKIELLNAYLPEIIVEHRTLYGVVSKGIHELSEDECKQYFDIVKTGIELILDEKIAKRLALEKKAKFTKELAKAHQELKE